MIKIYTHQNNLETITLNVCQQKETFGKDVYVNQTFYSREGAKILLEQLNEAAYELSEWIHREEKE